MTNNRFAPYDPETNPDTQAESIVELHKRVQDERDYKGIEIDEHGNVMNPQSDIEDKKQYGSGLYRDSLTGAYYDQYGRECDEHGNRY